MNDYSLIERIKILMNIIVSSPLFLACCMIAVAIFIFFIMSIKKEKKINKWFFIGTWCLILIILIINYNSIVLNLINSLFDAIFMTLYFPTFPIYITILCISNVIFFYSILKKNLDKKHKITNFSTTLIINILLLLIIDIVQVNKINMNDKLVVYSNSDLMVLLQFTSAIFTSWILLTLLISAHNKLKKYDKKELVPMPEIVFEEI